MTLALNFAARSDIGLGRYKNNQDSGYAGPHLLVVCDGMGGHAGGDIASSITIAELAALDADDLGADDAATALEESIHTAHASLRERVAQEPELAGMGTTVTALLRTGNRLVLCHVGDSRAYVLHAGVLSQITRDHTFVQWLVDEGRITPAEADTHPQRNVVMRVLGEGDVNSDIDMSVRPANPGERWMLCSDGLSGYVSHDTIAQTLAQIADPGQCADRLIELALRAGGQDNITCVVADVVPTTEAPPTVPQVVGAAALHQKNHSAANPDTPAARAAALRSSVEDPFGDEEVALEGNDIKPRRRRALLWTALPLIVVGLLAVAGVLGWKWLLTNYYVGAHDKNVAIFQGVPESLGPFHLNRVSEDKHIPLSTLNDTDREEVSKGISAQSEDHAQQITRSILRQSKLCQVATTPLPPTSSLPTFPPTPAPTPEAAPSAGATPPPASQQPTAAPTGFPAPAPSLTPMPAKTNVLGQPLPDDCRGG